MNNFSLVRRTVFSNDENLVHLPCRQYVVHEFRLNDRVKRIELHAGSTELTAKQAEFYKYLYLVTYDCNVMLVPTKTTDGSTNNTRLLRKNVPF